MIKPPYRERIYSTYHSRCSSTCFRHALHKDHVRTFLTVYKVVRLRYKTFRNRVNVPPKPLIADVPSNNLLGRISWNRNGVKFFVFDRFNDLMNNLIFIEVKRSDMLGIDFRIRRFISRFQNNNITVKRRSMASRYPQQ